MADAERDDIFQAAYQVSREAGADEAVATTAANRQLHQAGYYLTKDGWQRLGPDLRGKINVREAEKQPDDKYVIRGVDAFYPNAVKGAEDETQWSSDRVKQAIENSNRAVEAGGQACAITRTHIYPEQKVLGVSIPSFGSAINWRESPRGEGWARCDLVDVHSSVVDDWRDKKITGMSVGFVKDSGGLNERFGHLALLGGESQALSALPVTEVYSCEDELQLVYSTDAAEIMEFAANSSDPQMPKPNTVLPVKGVTPEVVMDPKHAEGMKNAYAGMSAAYAGMEAGEAGADEKVAEAHRMLESAAEACKAEGGSMNMMGPAKPGGVVPAPVPATAGPGFMGHEEEKKPDEYMAGQEPQETTYLPKNTQTNMHQITPTQVETAPKPATNEFSAMNPQITSAIAAKDKEIHQLQIAVAALAGRQMTQDFTTDVQALQNLGHQIDMEAASGMFSECNGEKSRIDALMVLLKTSTKSALTSKAQTFAADGNAAPAEPGQEVNPLIAPDDDVMAILRKECPNINFSAEDIALGTHVTGNNGQGALRAL